MRQRKFVIYCFLIIIQRDELRQKKEPELLSLDLRFPKEHCFLESFQASPVSPSENSTMQMDKYEYWAQTQIHVDNIQSVPRSKHTSRL